MDIEALRQARIIEALNRKRAREEAARAASRKAVEDAAVSVGKAPSTVTLPPPRGSAVEAVVSEADVGAANVKAVAAAAEIRLAAEAVAAQKAKAAAEAAAASKTAAAQETKAAEEAAAAADAKAVAEAAAAAKTAAAQKAKAAEEAAAAAEAKAAAEAAAAAKGMAAQKAKESTETSGAATLRAVVESAEAVISKAARGVIVAAEPPKLKEPSRAAALAMKRAAEAVAKKTVDAPSPLKRRHEGISAGVLPSVILVEDEIPEGVSDLKRARRVPVPSAKDWLHLPLPGFMEGRPGKEVVTEALVGPRLAALEDSCSELRRELLSAKRQLEELPKLRRELEVSKERLDILTNAVVSAVRRVESETSPPFMAGGRHVIRTLVSLGLIKPELITDPSLASFL